MTRFRQTRPVIHVISLFRSVYILILTTICVLHVDLYIVVCCTLLWILYTDRCLLYWLQLVLASQWCCGITEDVSITIVLTYYYDHCLSVWYFTICLSTYVINRIRNWWIFTLCVYPSRLIMTTQHSIPHIGYFC